MSEGSILVVNTGSSSLKCGVYRDDRLLFDALADGVKLEIKDAGGRTLRSENFAMGTEADALGRIAQWLGDMSMEKPGAIGHRVVHGGPRLVEHQRITPAVLKELQACVHFAPLHIPLSLALIEKTQQIYADVPQFACFDTAFHQTMPEAAARLPLSRELFQEGIRRYGFHGLSYESIVHQLGENLPTRVVIAHLGSGASLVALKDGRSVDTSMGMTPTGGIPMATRSGDLDPGVILYLLRVKHMTADSLEKLLNHEAGLKALSGGKSDMRELEASDDPDAELAIEIFCRSIRKTIAAYAAVLGGLDLLVFTGGIGEHSARIRNTVCADLDFLDITSKVRVIPSQEDLQIARHCRAMNAMMRS